MLLATARWQAAADDADFAMLMPMLRHFRRDAL